MRVGWHGAPEEHGHARLGAAILEDAARIGHAVVITREEKHGHAVIALVGQKMAATLRFLAEEVQRDEAYVKAVLAGLKK